LFFLVFLLFVFVLVSTWFLSFVFVVGGGGEWVGMVCSVGSEMVIRDRPIPVLLVNAAGYPGRPEVGKV
ncbi:hypothetical protein KJR58_24390, partial [Escherichia coli]|uniref:hypothetical protein n=1 Tax=Escherichia coli TaxID=562 RepID=UPI002004F5A4